MAELLIRLKLAILRHSLRGGQRTYLWLGGLIGFVLALGTVAAGLGPPPGGPVAMDTLAELTALWLFGWIFVSLAGSDVLQPEAFALLPIGRRRLALGLLVASFVGVLPAATIVAFSGLVVTSVALGPAPTLVALVSTLLLLPMVVVFAKVIVALAGQAVNARFGLELAGLQSGLLIALIWIWIPIAAVSGSSTPPVLSAPGLAVIARVVPTGWGVVAVEAATRSDWPVVVATLGGLAVVVVVLVAAWGALLDRRLTGGGARARSGARRRDDPGRARGQLDARLAPGGPDGALLEREIRSWQRDPRRGVAIRGAAWSAVILAILPAAFGSTVLLPFAGLTFVLMAGVLTANLYGMDGTAIWLTLMTPLNLPLDVRARQVAWILVIGVPGLIATVLMTALSGETWAWPWVLAAYPGVVAGAAALGPLLGILVPAPLPVRRTGDLLDLGDDPRTTNAYMLHGVLMTFLVPLVAVPALVVAAVASSDGSPAIWLGLPVGILTGLAAVWAGGRLAGWRLDTAGPELLDRMRSRPPARPMTAPSAQAKVPASAWVAILVGSILLFPQSVAPALLRVSGSESRLWFAPLYLPDPLQPLAIVALGLLGALFYAYAWRRIRRSLGTGRRSGRAR